MAEGDGGNPGFFRSISSLFLPSEWLLLLVLATVHFANIIDFMIVMPLGPEYQSYFGITPEQFGLAVSAYGIAASVSGFLAAQCVDRFDRRTSLLFLFAGFTLCTFACGFAPTFPLLVLARTATGAFGGVLGACVLAIVGDVFPEERRGTAMGILMSSFSVASILGLPLGLLLAEWLGWRAPFIVLGVLAMAIYPLAFKALPPLRRHLGQASGGAESNLWTVLTHPTHLRAYGLMVSLVIMSFMMFPYLAIYLVRNVGLDKRGLEYVYALGGLTTLGTLTWVGWLSDRLGKLPVFRTFALLTGVVILLLTHLPRVPLLVALAATTLLFVTSSSRMVPAMAMITSSTTPRYRGSFMSVISSVQHMAMGLSSLVAGFFLGEAADGTMTGYGTVGIIAAVASVASVAWAGQLRLREEAPVLEEEEAASDPSVRLPYGGGIGPSPVAVPAPSTEGAE